MKIIVGITTAPRAQPTFYRTYESVVAAGFDAPYVFADGYTPNQIEQNLVVRPQTIAPPRFHVTSPIYGAWRNWVQSLLDLLSADENADGLLVVQDDVLFCKHVREFLEAGHWRLPGAGVIALALSWAYRGIADKRGLNLLSTNRVVLAGAWALLFPRDAAKAILAHELSQEGATGWHYRGAFEEPSQAKGIDTFVGQVLLKLGRPFYGYRPSLAEHIGETSTIHSGGLTGNRKTISWPGPEADARTLFDV